MQTAWDSAAGWLSEAVLGGTMRLWQDHYLWAGAAWGCALGVPVLVVVVVAARSLAREARVAVGLTAAMLVFTVAVTASALLRAVSLLLEAW